MMMRYAILLFVVATASSQESILERRYDRTPLGDQVDKASVKILKEVYLASGESNVVTAPLGVLTLLSLYSAGVQENSKNEIMTLLGSTDYIELSQSYMTLGETFNAMDPSYLVFANKIYVSKDYTLNEAFSSTARSYGSEVDTIDFSDTKSAASIINQWADEKTKGHIKDPVAEDLLGKDVTAALLNVIFFQGHWDVPFKANETKEKDFHVNGSLTVKKPMMHLQEYFFYYEDDEIGARMIELPYRETGFRMVVILPNEVDGLTSVLDKVGEKGLLKDIFELGPSEREINLYLPKFDIRSKLDYTKILPKLGVKRIFNEIAPGIVKNSGVVVSELFQEAFVKIDEEGATAGAVTTAIIWAMATIDGPPPPLDFIVDHPFLFAILHEDVILFTGTYSQ